jgi:hypothetical protein
MHLPSSLIVEHSIIIINFPFDFKVIDHEQNNQNPQNCQGPEKDSKQMRTP